MAKLSITTAWNETAPFVRREARLLFPLAFMLLALPAGMTRALMPIAPAGQLPEAGPWIAMLILALVCLLIGNLAISYLAIRAGTSVGEALAQGARRAPPLAGAALLLCGAYLALLFLISFIVFLIVPGAAAAAAAGATNEAIGRASLIILALILPLLLFFSARLILMPPITAAEPGGPFTIIARSWRLTSGHSLKLVGFILIVGALSLILQIAVEGVFGSLFILAAGRAEPGSVSALLILLVMAALNTVLGVYVAALVARLYAQRAGDQPSRGT